MTPQEARRLLVAAKDDPVVAAWAAVLHEHKAAAPTDVSPYEAWDAFQALYDAGVVTTHDFDTQQGVFFERPPSRNQIESALTNLHILPEPDALEDMMKKDLFSKIKESNALQKAPPTSTGLGAPMQRQPLSAPIVRQPLGRPMTSPPPGVPGRKSGLQFGPPPAATGGLPCVTGDTSIELKAVMPCARLGCNGQVRLVDLGPIGISETEIAALSDNGDVRLFKSFYGAECEACGLIQQSLVGLMPQ